MNPTPPPPHPAGLAVQPVLPGELSRAGEAANRIEAMNRFSAYRQRRAEQTLRRQDTDLALFSSFLSTLDLETGALNVDPESWHVITWGLVESFVQWQLREGYAIPSVNVRLSTLKSYARLALQAGTLSPQEYAMIRSVQGFSPQEQRRMDTRREKKRVGAKKAAPVVIDSEQARALKSQSIDKPQGRRDALMMCLLLDHGLRVGELAALSVEDFDLSMGLLRFYRAKVGKVQIHRLSPDALRAAKDYQGFGDMPLEGVLLRASLKNQSLTAAGMTERAITQRVRLLGQRLGIVGLSAHDCRHYWATTAARHGTDPFSLQEAGGWSSLAMPRRYVADNEIANNGVILTDE